MSWTNALLVEHFDAPRRAGELAAAAGVSRGDAGSEHQGALVRFTLKSAADGRIEDIRFKAWGCPATIACASMVAEWAPGRTRTEAAALDVRALVDPLELPVERLYAPLLVEDALRAAAGGKA